MQVPCGKDCPDRAAGCHAACERWAVYEKERNAAYEEKLLNITTREYYHDQKIKRAHYECYKRRSRRK